MRTHPAAPLTTANEIHYKAIERARRKLHRAKTIDEKIKARNAIGEATAEILRQRRKEQAPVSNPIESKLVIQYLDNGEWKDLSSYALTDIQTAYNVYNQLTSSKSTLDAYRLVNVKVDLLAANQATEAK